MFKVPRQSAITSEPPKGALYDPAMRQDLKAFLPIGASDDVERPAQVLAHHFHDRGVGARVLPEAQGIRAIHQPNLASAKDKLFKFLSGWLGGPNLFIEEFGHPMLRARHLRFAIGESERDQWMLCMNKALAEMTMDPRLKTNLQNALQQLATHLINQK